MNPVAKETISTLYRKLDNIRQFLVHTRNVFSLIVTETAVHSAASCSTREAHAVRQCTHKYFVTLEINVNVKINRKGLAYTHRQISGVNARFVYAILLTCI